VFGIGSHMPIRNEFWYSVNDSPDTRFRCVSIFSDWRDRANDAAENYWGDHDGWESRWPLMFAFYETEDGPEVRRAEIHMEAVPTFDVGRWEPQSDGEAQSVPTPKA
jgi:hypothetical protein